MGADKPEPPEQLSLIPNKNASTKKIAQSVYETVLAWKDFGKLPQAIEDFLLRRRPRIKGNPAGPIIAQDSDVVQGTIKAVLNWDNSGLCIQGPPAAGKTYTAAQAIVALLNNKQTVGITSNSHKAIAKLMKK